MFIFHAVFCCLPLYYEAATTNGFAFLQELMTDTILTIAPTTKPEAVNAVKLCRVSLTHLRVSGVREVTSIAVDTKKKKMRPAHVETLPKKTKACKVIIRKLKIIPPTSRVDLTKVLLEVGFHEHHYILQSSYPSPHVRRIYPGKWAAKAALR